MMFVALFEKSDSRFPPLGGCTENKMSPTSLEDALRYFQTTAQNLNKTTSKLDEALRAVNELIQMWRWLPLEQLSFQERNKTGYHYFCAAEFHLPASIPQFSRPSTHEIIRSKETMPCGPLIRYRGESAAIVLFR
jgi:hypothetical protein